MLDQLNFVLVISFFNDIIHVDKINIYSKIFIVDDTIPKLTLLLKLFHLHFFLCRGSQCCFVCANRTLSVKVRISVSNEYLTN